MLAVAVSLHPEWYSGGEKADDGSAWEVLGETYETNPRLQVEEWAWAMIPLWRLYQGGAFRAQFAAMGGGGIVRGRMVGHLPDAGGTLDQAAIMLEAFGAMDFAEAQEAERES